mmetsp:Transcript_22713/g.25357  ORF Transcript_22713/g.25357 Transcript_22713/m.25357 type:complete len:125 (+) Transcript_22713:224-598(+)
MYVEGEKDLGLISEEILDSCLLYGSKDNMTAILIQLPACEKSYALAKAAMTAATIPQKQEGVVGRRRIRNNLQNQNSNEHQNHNHTTNANAMENQNDNNHNQNNTNAMDNSNIHQNQYDEHKYT